MNEHATRLRLLFVGNSHTFFNDMPEMVAERFRKDGYDCEVAMIAHGGWSLSQLVEEPEVQFNIRYGHYDYVMLQDMSNPFESERRFIRSIAILVQWIRETGARPILYLPWTRCDGESRQAAMTASYKKASEEFSVPLAPAGEFWWEYRREHPETEMYYEDGTHASEAGSEFVAGYIYCTILADMKQNMEQKQ